jgi:MoxR-like ATPase
VAERSLTTVLFLALKMGRPLFLEGEADVGKTDIAKVLSGTLGRRLIRLQCYEGLDVAAAVYERNYAAQMTRFSISLLAQLAPSAKSICINQTHSKKLLAIH